MACQVFRSDPPRSLIEQGESPKFDGGYHTKHLKVLSFQHSHDTVFRDGTEASNAVDGHLPGQAG